MDSVTVTDQDKVQASGATAAAFDPMTHPNSHAPCQVSFLSSLCMQFMFWLGWRGLGFRFQGSGFKV